MQKYIISFEDMWLFFPTLLWRSIYEFTAMFRPLFLFARKLNTKGRVMVVYYMYRASELMTCSNGIVIQKVIQH